MSISFKASVLLGLAALPALAMDPPGRLPLLASARPAAPQSARPTGVAKATAIQRIIAQARAGAPVDEGMTHRRLALAASQGGANHRVQLGGSHRPVQGFGSSAAAASHRPAAGTLTVPALRPVWAAAAQQPQAALGTGVAPKAAAASSSSAWAGPAEWSRAAGKAPQPLRYLNTSGEAHSIALELAPGHPPVEALVTWSAEGAPTRHTEALLGGEERLRVPSGQSVVIALAEGAMGRFLIRDGATKVLSRHPHGFQPAAKTAQAEPELTLEDLG
jgi:hypothetical protein